MNKHCNKCIYHHIAGHHKTSPLAKNYNNWCSHFGRAASKSIGECKLKNSKKITDNIGK